MTEEKLSTEEKILLAAIECIEAQGIEQATTRRIAEIAGTNIASINYYFRTKEELIARALTRTADHMLEDVFAELEKVDQPFHEVVNEVLFYLIDGGRRYPQLTTAHLYSAVVENDYASPGSVAIWRAFDRLAERAINEFGDIPSVKLRFALSHVLGSIMFMLLAPGFFKLEESYLPIDVDRSRALANYFTDQFFAGVKSPQPLVTSSSS